MIYHDMRITAVAWRNHTFQTEHRWVAPSLTTNLVWQVPAEAQEAEMADQAAKVWIFFCKGGCIFWGCYFLSLNGNCILNHPSLGGLGCAIYGHELQKAGFPSLDFDVPLTKPSLAGPRRRSRSQDARWSFEGCGFVGNIQHLSPFDWPVLFIFSVAVICSCIFLFNIVQ